MICIKNIVNEKKCSLQEKLKTMKRILAFVGCELRDFHKLRNSKYRHFC